MFDPGFFSKALLATLRKACGRGLSPFVRGVVKRVAGRRDAQVSLDADGSRALTRMGVLEAGADAAARDETFRRFLEQVARATGEDPVGVGVMLRLFASGAYGVLAEPVCGERPHCDRCGFAPACRFVLSGGKGRPKDGAAIAAQLLADRARELADAELIAFLLEGERATPQSVAGAEGYLERVGSFHALAAGAISGHRPDLAGLSPSQAAHASCAIEVLRRYVEEPPKPGKTFATSADFYEHFHLRLRDRRQEVFCVALLDQKHRLLDDPEISAGTLTNTLVHPREVFAPAIQRRAAAIALIHNHPSGDPKPSNEDKRITRRLAEVAELTDIRLLDHVIVGDESYFSFADKRML